MGGRRGNDADARKLTALTFCLANEAFEGGWPHLMRRDRLRLPPQPPAASHSPIADQATPKSELRKLPTSATALPWGPFRFPQTRRPTAAHLLCDACYLYQRCLSSFTEFLRGLMRLY